MKALIQRCSHAQVLVEGEIVGKIERGLTIFLGVEQGDDEAKAARLARKIAGLRVFDNSEGRFDLSLRDVGGQVLAISNFTLCGDARKGTRPNFSGAASPGEAQELYGRFATLLQEQGVKVETGRFGAHMQVLVENDGPVSMLLDG
jgi:D-tyrosyl-tRNA(Tyr) deacylase